MPAVMARNSNVRHSGLPDTRMTTSWAEKFFAAMTDTTLQLRRHMDPVPASDFSGKLNIPISQIWLSANVQFS